MPKASVRVHLDIDISYEEANYIRETLIPEYGLREVSLIPIKNEQLSQEGGGDIKFESVDQIVLESITNIESEFYDSKLLLEIYNGL